MGGYMTANEKFEKKASLLHKNVYDYSKINYVNNSTNIKITCKSHGVFEQLPKNHLAGKGCPKCALKNRTLDRFSFIKKSKKIHGKRYTYQKSSYKNNTIPITITCREHGDFDQLPKHHLVGKGCPSCNSNSTGESMVAVYLDEIKIQYEQEIPLFKNPETGCYLRADFFIEKLNLVIEFDGLQHFEPIEYFGGEEHHLQCVSRDKIKNNYCKKQGINIIRIPYYKKNEIRPILNKVIEQLETTYLMAA
jgi:very-short-patch-repair endonuclease/Zn finger protein HypA/HybF involved in hydrogenase expression